MGALSKKKQLSSINTCSGICALSTFSTATSVDIANIFISEQFSKNFFVYCDEWCFVLQSVDFLNVFLMAASVDTATMFISSDS